MSLEQRTKQFSLSIIKLFESMSKSSAGQIIGKQMLRSGTSVGAQYREARRARSRAEFSSKVDSAIQELDETTYWFELLTEANIVPQKDVDLLMKEANELLSMLVSSSKTAKANNTKSS